MINPALYQSPRHARLIGLMVVCYGDLELSLRHIAGIAIGRKFDVLHALNQIRSETAKIDASAALARNAIAEKGFGSDFSHTIGYMRFCAKIRNQYAHAEWSRHGKRLRFLTADDIFRNASERNNPQSEFPWRPITMPILKQQEAFFIGTRKWLMWLEAHLANVRSVKLLRKPPIMQRPPLDGSPRRSVRNRKGATQ